MPTKGVSMRKLKQLVRLHYQSGLSVRKIARSLNLSVGVVSKYVNKLHSSGLGSDKLLELDEAELGALVREKPSGHDASSSKSLSSIDFAKLHQQLKRKGVTMQLLWEEYADGNSQALSYSRFCYHYRQWKRRQPSSMRQTHKAGDKVFVDYSGQTVDLIDPDTGEIRSAQVFIGVLGASNFTYAEATWTQKLHDWIGSQRRMFEYFGCVPALIVPDNLKSAIRKSCRYEPDVNPTYSEFAQHYSTAVLPARPYKPKDKAKAEAGVQLVQRWILARLRHHTFVGLGELNMEIRKLVDVLNDKPFKKLPGARRSAFESIDKPAMHLLEGKTHPEQAYRSCLGLLNLAKQYGEQRLEAACTYGWNNGVRSRKSIASILQNGLDQGPRQPSPGQVNIGQHNNVRGSNYYH